MTRATRSAGTHQRICSGATTARTRRSTCSTSAYDTRAIIVTTTTVDHNEVYRLVAASTAIMLPSPVPVASHSATVAASSEVGAAIRAEAKKDGAIAGSRPSISTRAGGVA